MNEITNVLNELFYNHFQKLQCERSVILQIIKLEPNDLKKSFRKQILLYKLRLFINAFPWGKLLKRNVHLSPEHLCMHITTLSLLCHFKTNVFIKKCLTDICTSLSHFIIFSKHSRIFRIMWGCGRRGRRQEPYSCYSYKILKMQKQLTTANIYIILGGLQIAFTNIITCFHAEG